jgi:hypothetical protein
MVIANLVLPSLFQPGLEEQLVYAVPADLLPLYVFGGWFLLMFVGGGWMHFRR